MRRKVLVLNKAYYPNNVISWKAAFRLIFEEKAEAIEYYDEVIKSSSAEFKIPCVLVLKDYTKFRNVIKYSKRGVHSRDNYHCVYCGFKFPTSKLTIDHIIPKSKGGENGWMNCISACFACNSKKKNRTPEEANMPLLYHPFVPTYGLEYFENWDGEVIEQWINYLPKKKVVEIKVVEPEIKYGRKHGTKA